MASPRLLSGDSRDAGRLPVPAIRISNLPSKPAPSRADATKASHGPARELFKQCAAGVTYGMEAEGLARRIGSPPIVARDLLRAHHETYRTFLGWSDAAVDHAMLHRLAAHHLRLAVHVGENPNPRSLRNFPMQANGAEMLRLAACFATEQGIEVCALIHDAVLIAAPLERLEDDTADAGRHGEGLEHCARRF